MLTIGQNWVFQNCKHGTIVSTWQGPLEMSGIYAYMYIVPCGTPESEIQIYAYARVYMTLYVYIVNISVEVFFARAEMGVLQPAQQSEKVRDGWKIRSTFPCRSLSIKIPHLQSVHTYIVYVT